MPSGTPPITDFEERYSRYLTLLLESMKWLAALKRARTKHFLGFAISTWSSMFDTKAKAKVEVKVEDRGSNLGVKVISIGL